MKAAALPSIELLAPKQRCERQPAPWLPNSACIDWSHHPALLRAFAQAQDLPDDALLDALGYAAWPLPGMTTRISPSQLLAMLACIRQQHDALDTAFLLGQSWLPGHYGPASHALLEAATLGDALHLLCEHAASLFPLQAPRLIGSGPDVVLCWIDAGLQLGALRPFVVDLHMAAVRSLCEWLGSQKLPWRFHFNRTRPRRIEQHEVYLGPHLKFDCHVDAMCLPRHFMMESWPRHRPVGASAAGAALLATGPVSRGLLDWLYDYLLHALRADPSEVSLDSAAQSMGVSAATLKRRLALAGTHFQAELDQVRSHLALYLMHVHGWGNDALAEAFGFHDRTNFRRAFKRWTGVTPSLLRTRSQ